MQITDQMTGKAPAIIFIVIFLSIFIYLLIMIAHDGKELYLYKKARQMIEEGHKKATKGNKHDGFYKETKRAKYKNEVDKCKEKAEAVADHDLQLLQ